jgi:putative toxin-antitoxin system antitoxin component (TIGR02293 family)
MSAIEKAVDTDSKKTARKPDFWYMARDLATLSERERIIKILSGFESAWLGAVKSAFQLNAEKLALLANISTATLDRRLKSKSVLDKMVSERLDRLAQVAVMAEDVFEDESIAAQWMSSPNSALGGDTPLLLCDTEIGARQVRRVLHAIEWGNSA